MNKPIEIILNTITATAADLNVASGVVTISDYDFPWKKLFDADKQLSVAGTAGIVTAVPGTLAANTEYAFFLTQVVGEERITERISWTSGSTAPTGAAVVCDQWRLVVLAHVNAGRLKITVPAAGAVTLILPASSVAYFDLSASNGPAPATASATTPGVAPQNLGSDLLADGIVDSFDGDLPLATSVYTSYEFTLMLPQGSGGFNEQTSDQEQSLVVYLDQGATNYANLVTDMDHLIAGEDATVAGWDFVTGALSV